MTPKANEVYTRLNTLFKRFITKVPKNDRKQFEIEMAYILDSITRGDIDNAIREFNGTLLRDMRDASNTKKSA